MEKVDIVLTDPKILEKVNEALLDDALYYGEYGKQFLHNSDIYALLNNPASFRVREETTALLYGRAFHEIVMFAKFNEDVVDASTRNTKIYKDAVERNGGQMMLLQKEMDEIVELRERAYRNNMFASVLNSAEAFEVPNSGTLTENNLIWACKADIITDEYVYDIKTTSSLIGFNKSSRSYNYDSQAYIYSSMFQKPMRFLVVEKGSGAIGLFDVSEDAYLRGRDKVEKAEEVYMKYYMGGKDNVKDHFVHDTI
jgi:hypothetical protein